MDVGSQATALSMLNAGNTQGTNGPGLNQAGFSPPGSAALNPASQYLSSDQLNQNPNGQSPLASNSMRAQLLRRYEDPGFMVSTYNPPDSGNTSNAPKIKNPGEIVATAGLVVDGVVLTTMFVILLAMALGKQRGRPAEFTYDSKPDSKFQEVQMRELQAESEADDSRSANKSIVSHSARAQHEELPTPPKAVRA